MSVASEWVRRLASAEALAPAREVYGGRAFREAEAAAAACNGVLRVISAGTGLITADTPIPAYGLTISRGQADSILHKVTGDAGSWWSALTAVSPFHQDLIKGDGLLLAAVPAPYLAMVAADWLALPEAVQRRLRLFTKEKPRGEAARLAEYWMPYDDRLEAAGPGYAGTQTDFAQRALRHFVDKLGVTGISADDDAAAVQEALAGLEPPQRPERTRLDDDAISSLIAEHWEAVGGQSGLMLRHLRRGLGVACEQGRFKLLFHGVAAARGGAAQ